MVGSMFDGFIEMVMGCPAAVSLGLLVATRSARWNDTKFIEKRLETLLVY
ncbi:MAG: hypothetical protein QXE01_04270 [Sulfolobales archaeon]